MRDSRREPFVCPRATRTAEDLMTVIACSEQIRIEREGRLIPPKNPILKRLVEAPLNLVGLLIYRFVESIPAGAAMFIHKFIYTALAGGRASPFDPHDRSLELARDLIEKVSARTGKEPALLALLSHPPVSGEKSYLMFELVRHAALSLRQLRGYSSRPRLVAAVDAFALDSISLAGEGVYAGTMGHYHIGIDRMSVSRNNWSKRILARASWPRTTWRLIRSLREGGEVYMVLSGGVPATARVLYTAREWLARCRAESPLRHRPGEALRRLRESSGFREFEARGWSQRSAWRSMDLWLAAALQGGLGEAAVGLPSADSGNMSPEASEVAARCLAALELSSGASRRFLEEFRIEFSRETPYRSRLFSVLSRRVLAAGRPLPADKGGGTPAPETPGAGRPLVFLPLVHDSKASKIKIMPPWAWCETASDGRVKALFGGEKSFDWEGGVEDFSRRFVAENFI